MAWLRILRRKRRSSSSSGFYSLQGTRSQIVSRLTALSFFGLLGLVVLSLVVFFWYAKDLPEPGKIVRTEGFSTKIYDRNEKLLYDIYANQRRTEVALDKMPLYLRQATIAIEDQDFYKHGGFDPKGWIRSVYYITFYRKLSGGSTLTQQLVKNVLLTSDRTITRKIKEFILAVQIERKYNKDQILSMYLNEAPYGGTAWGVGAASEVYFNKDVSDLDLIESAILAGLPQRPSVYSPYSTTPNAYKNRTKDVLRRMREDGYISKDQENEALEGLDKVKFADNSSNLKAPHFVMYVKKLLEDRYGEKVVEQDGLKVMTSLDLDLQEKAQKIIADEIAKVEKVHITNGAALVMDPRTGEILAMVGSKNYNDPNYDGKVNVVTSLRQPGSAIKPVTYVTAFKKGYTPSTLIMDTPTTFPGGVGQPDYKPVNYNGKFSGPVQVRYALGNSLNVPAVKMLALVGIKDMLQTASDLGFTTLSPTPDNLSRLGLSVTLGGGEVRLLDMVSAYSSFANGGNKISPVAILKVTDNKNNVKEEFKAVESKRVITSQQAFLISNILSDNSARAMTFGERSSLSFADMQVSVKTGTTNDKRDNWTVGWMPNIIIGVWVGNNDNSQMKELASGVTGAAPIWRRVILEAVNGRPKEDFTIPDGVVSAEVDSLSGMKSHDGFASRMEFFVKGTEPVGEDQIHAKLKLCKNSHDKLATPVDVSRGNFDEQEFFVFKENDPTAGGGENKWQKGIDEWLALQGDARYHPPSEYCQGSDQIDIRIKEPSDHSQVGSSFDISVDPVSVNNITSVEIYIGGDKKATLTNYPYKQSFSLGDGVYTIKVRAQDEKGNTGEKEIKIGVNLPWDWAPSPTPTNTSTPTPSPIPTPTP
ncbi:MAG: PBP1A family penicillin-binding protein [bacterium]|nr:PBP1A family penicillin-binding protein [bacterium]